MAVVTKGSSTPPPGPYSLTFEAAQGHVVDIRDISRYLHAAVNTRNLIIDIGVSVFAWLALVVILALARGYPDGFTLTKVATQMLWQPPFVVDGQVYRLANVSSPALVWAWVEKVVLPQTFADTPAFACNSSLLFDATTGGHWLWGLRFKQTRAAKELCDCSDALTQHLLGGMECAGATACSGAVDHPSQLDTSPFPGTGSSPASAVLSTPVLDEDFRDTSSYTWRAMDGDRSLSDSGHVVDLYYCDGAARALAVIREMAEDFLSAQTRSLTVEMFRLHASEHAVLRLAVTLEQTQFEDWRVATVPATAVGVVVLSPSFSSPSSTAAAAANVLTPLVIAALLAKLYFVNVGWALLQVPRGTATAGRWNLTLAVDVVLLLMWVTHAVAFVVNWATYAESAARLLEDIEDNRLSSVYHTSGALHVRAFPGAGAAAFNTAWLVVASLRLAQVLLLDRLSYAVVAKAMCLRSCCHFQAGIALYAVVLVGVVCLVCLVLFGESLDFFGDVAGTISTVVGYSL